MSKDLLNHIGNTLTTNSYIFLWFGTIILLVIIVLFVELIIRVNREEKRRRERQRSIWYSGKRILSAEDIEKVRQSTCIKASKVSPGPYMKGNNNNN